MLGFLCPDQPFHWNKMSGDNIHKQRKENLTNHRPVCINELKDKDERKEKNRDIPGNWETWERKVIIVPIIMTRFYIVVVQDQNLEAPNDNRTRNGFPMQLTQRYTMRCVSEIIYSSLEFAQSDTLGRTNCRLSCDWFAKLGCLSYLRKKNSLRI